MQNVCAYPDCVYKTLRKMHLPKTTAKICQPFSWPVYPLILNPLQRSQHAPLYSSLIPKRPSNPPHSRNQQTDSVTGPNSNCAYTYVLFLYASTYPVPFLALAQ